MREISRKAHDAFINRKRFTSSNTKIEIDNNKDAYMYLFNNLIAKTEGDDIFISDGGYGYSVTTKDRLSAFVEIRGYKRTFIIDEKFKWDGKWIRITNKDA